MTEHKRLTEEPFGDRLSRRVAERASQLVVGLDPDPAKLWPRAYEIAAARGVSTGGDSPAMRAALAVAIHCALVVEAVAEDAVAIKLQVACFERLGAPGWAALAETVDRAREQGLLVIADGKRGDVGVTATAYGQAFFGVTPTPYGVVAGIAADALTVNPLLGIDALEPLIDAARDAAGAVFVLVRTSNPGAADLQDLDLKSKTIVSERFAATVSERFAATVSERLAALVHELGEPGIGQTGLSDVGAVVGATAPKRLAGLRELMPQTPFLLPGVGAQGGRVQDLAAALGDDRASLLVSSSRGIVDAGAQTGSDPAKAARTEAARLRELAWTLRS